MEQQNKVLATRQSKAFLFAAGWFVAGAIVLAVGIYTMLAGTFSSSAENAGIELRRQVLTDITDLNSVTEIVIPANDLRWALPINEVERQLLGWEQNAGWE